MAKKNARLTKSLAGTGEMKLEQLHACVNQIPAEESGLHLLDCVKREVVICTIWEIVVRTYAIGGDAGCQRHTEYLDGFCADIGGSGASSRKRGAVLRPRDYTGKFC
jgi:hypothetical protein